MGLLSCAPSPLHSSHTVHLMISYNRSVGDAAPAPGAATASASYQRAVQDSAPAIDFASAATHILSSVGTAIATPDQLSIDQRAVLGRLGKGTVAGVTAGSVLAPVLHAPWLPLAAGPVIGYLTEALHDHPVVARVSGKAADIISRTTSYFP
jgi:hypothetical protein